MAQIYDTPQGPALRVRSEPDGEHLFARVDSKARMISTFRSATIPKDFTLIHDPGARAEANLALAENGALVREKQILLECLAAALGQLDERSANQVRDIYSAKIKEANLISLTKPKEIVSA